MVSPNGRRGVTKTRCMPRSSPGITSVNLTDAVNEVINGTVRLVARRHGGGNRSILEIRPYNNTHFVFPPAVATR